MFVSFVLFGESGRVLNSPYFLGHVYAELRIVESRLVKGYRYAGPFSINLILGKSCNSQKLEHTLRLRSSFKDASTCRVECRHEAIQYQIQTAYIVTWKWFPSRIPKTTSSRIAAGEGQPDVLLPFSLPHKPTNQVQGIIALFGLLLYWLAMADFFPYLTLSRANVLSQGGSINSTPRATCVMDNGWHARIRDRYLNLLPQPSKSA